MILFLLFGIIATNGFIGVDERLSATAAEQYCAENYGTNLATIHSTQDDLDAWEACNSIDGSDGECWIGYRRGSLYQHWYWTSEGDPFSQEDAYTNWNSYCARYDGRRSQGRWAEEYCYSKGEDRYFVCNTNDAEVPMKCNVDFDSWYRADQYDKGSNTWTDMSGHARDIQFGGVKEQVTVAQEAKEINDKPYISGTQATNLVFKPAQISGGAPNFDYTFFHVARYGAPNEDNKCRRIFTSTADNWLSGYWATRCQSAHHNHWITGTEACTKEQRAQWRITTDTPFTFRANGKNLQNGDQPKRAVGAVSINIGGCCGTETSDYNIAEVIIIAGKTEPIQTQRCVEAYLAKRYDIKCEDQYLGVYSNFKPGHGNVNDTDYKYYFANYYLGYIIIGLLILNAVCVLKYCYSTRKVTKKYKIVSMDTSDDASDV